MSKKVWESVTGVRHTLNIYRDYEPQAPAAYTVDLDGEFVARAESRLAAIEEAEDIICAHGWTHINPVCFW